MYQCVKRIIDLTLTSEKQEVIFDLYFKVGNELETAETELEVEMTDDIEFLLEITTTLLSTFLYLHKNHIKFENDKILQARFIIDTVY